MNGQIQTLNILQTTLAGLVVMRQIKVTSLPLEAQVGVVTLELSQEIARPRVLRTLHLLEGRLWKMTGVSGQAKTLLVGVILAEKNVELMFITIWAAAILS